MKKGFIILGIMVLALFMTACKKNITGKYNLMQMSKGEDVLTEYDLRSYGIHFEVDIEENGKATLIEGDKKTPLTYDETTFKGTDPVTKEERNFTYTINDRDLVLKENEDELVFKKEK